MNSSQKKNILIISFALFSMFFGAGNVIFPPFLGAISGQDFFQSSLGFIITGAGLPILGIIAIAKAGDFNKFAQKVFPSFPIILGTSIMIAIGPLLAIPKTAALTHEIGIVSLFGNVNLYVSIATFFVITLFFSINRNNVIDKLGLILTPLLLISLIILIIKGVLNPIGILPASGLENPFSRGFVEGYQTMDALASVMFAVVIIKTVQNKLQDQPEKFTITTSITGIIAGIGLALIYLGMIYIGATASSLFTPETTKSQMVIIIAQQVLGSFGKLFLAIIIGLACLTTSIGLTITAGEYFENISKGKLKYRWIVIFTCVFSCFMAYLGVDKIVAFSAPVLLALYPTVIALIVLNVIGIQNPNIYKGTCIPVLIYSILSTFLPADAVAGIKSIYYLFDHAFGWMPVAILGMVIGMLIGKMKKATE